MSRALKIQLEDFGGGINRYTSQFLERANEANLAVNCDITTPGKLKKNKDVSEVGTSTGTDAVDLLTVYQEGGGSNTLIRIAGSNVDVYNTTWSSVSTAFPDTQHEAANGFVDGEQRLYITCEHTNDVRYYNGTSISTISYRAKHIAYYKNRLYLANTYESSVAYPSRVRFSPEGEDTFLTNDYFDDKGETINALYVYGGYLYIFTENIIVVWVVYALRFVESTHGCTASSTVQNVKGYLMWYDASGIYIYGGSGVPQVVSKPIDDILSQITDVYNVVGGIDENGNYILTIGDVTIDGNSYSDVSLIYDLDNNAWSIRTGMAYSSYTVLLDDGGFVAYVGSDSDSKAYQLGNAVGTSSFLYEMPKLIIGEQYTDKVLQRVEVVYNVKTASSDYITVKVWDGSTWREVNSTSDNLSLSTTGINIARLNIDIVNSKTLAVQLSTTASNDFEIYGIYLYGYENI